MVITVSGGEQSDEEEVAPNSEPEQTLPLAILSWSAEEPEGGLYAALTPVQITLEIQNVSNKDISILDGFADSHDRLGNDIGTMRLPQDLNLAAQLCALANIQHRSSGYVRNCVAIE